MAVTTLKKILKWLLLEKFNNESFQEITVIFEENYRVRQFTRVSENRQNGGLSENATFICTSLEYFSVFSRTLDSVIYHWASG